MVNGFEGLEYPILSQRTLRLKHWIYHNTTRIEMVMVCARKVRRVRIHMLKKPIRVYRFWICDISSF